MDTNRQVDAKRAANFAWVALLGCVAVVIAAGFALTFHGLYGFGREIAHWGPALAALGPIADDGLTLVAIAATFLLAHAKAPRRPVVYAWFVFAVSCAASVAGNTAYALRPLPVWVGAVGAALCPLFVTLAAHLGVVCWRHCAPTGRTVAVTSKPRPAASDVPASASPAPPAGPTPSVQAAPSRGRRGSKPRTAKPDHRVEALRLVDAGLSPPKAAAKLGVTARSVQLWKKQRDQQQINGHVPAWAKGGGEDVDVAN